MEKEIKDMIDGLTELRQNLLASDMPKYANTVNMIITNLIDISNRLEIPIPKITENKLRQLFKDNFDIYGDSEGDVVMALTEDGFIKLFNLAMEEE